MAIGNLEAIRDWMNDTWYNKEEIHSLLSISSVYYLTFIGLPNQQLRITESEETTQSYSYNITLNSEGTYEGSFRFRSNKIKVRTTNNMLNESMLNLNNWIKNTPMSNAQFECIFEPYIKLTSETQTITNFNGINTVKFKGVSGYECLKFNYVDYNWDTYRFDMDFCTPSGFIANDNGECITCAYSTNTINSSLYYDYGAESIYKRCQQYTLLSGIASNNYTHYTHSFKSGVKNVGYLAVIDYGQITNDTEVTFKYSGLQVRRNP